MLVNNGWHQRIYPVRPVCLAWLLVILVALLIGLLSASTQFNLLVLGLIAGIAGLLLWLLQFVQFSALHVEKICFYLAFVTGFFGVALFPIDLGPFTLFPYRIFLLILWGLFMARALLQGKVVLPVRGVKLYMAFFGFWMAYALISLAWAASKGDAIRHLIFLFMGVSVIFFAVYYFRNLSDLSKLYWIWFSVFVGLILLGYWEHLTGQHLPVSGYYGETRARFMFRPTGVFHNPNDYATFLALGIPFALGISRYAKRWLPRLIGLGSTLAAFYLIVATGSRANMLAVLLEVGLLVAVLSNLRQKIKVAVIALAGVAMLLLFIPGYIRELVSEASRGLSSIATEAKLGAGSAAIRINLARNGLIFLLSTACLGVGAGNAEYWMANFARYDTAGTLNLHNWWLEILINYGVFVFAGYVAVYVSILRRLWHFWHKAAKGKERIVAESLLLALIGFFVASISSSSIMALSPQWMLFAFALAYLNYRNNARGEVKV